MKKGSICAVPTYLAFLLIAMFSFQIQAQAAPENKPNILLIVADDLGYTDIGPFGSEISTPNLDELASLGIRLSNFHVLPTCAPTRSVLLTGSDNHRAGLGSQILTAQQRGQPGYEGYLSPNLPTLAEVLSESGYRTYLSGKWHLGIKEGQRPHDRGFDETFSLLSGAASHFSDATGISPREPAIYSRNGQLVEKLPEDFYSSRAFTDSMLGWLNQNQQSEKPFFAYLSFTAPHDPLHAPEEYIVKYDGVYDEGYEALRERRHATAIQKGVISDQLVLGEWPRAVKRWHSLSDVETAERLRDMQTYAAMIDYMDEQIGRVIQWLKNNGEYKNTLIVFISDNGANAFSSFTYPGHTAEYHAQFDNSQENRGLEGSFTELGAGWASASTGGLRLFKVFSAEGGIRVPAIIKPVENAEGDLNHSFIHVQDIMPSLLKAANVEYSIANNSDLPGMNGRSLVPLFQGDASYSSEPPGIGYELHGNRALFSGQWKILQMPIPMGSGNWELFNIDEDPGETNNLANKHPDILALLVSQHEQYEKDVGVIYGLFGLPAKIAKQMKTLFFSLTLLGFLGVLWGMYSRKLNVIILAFAHLAGVMLLIIGKFYLGTFLLLSAIAGGIWYAVKNKKWFTLGGPVLSLMLLFRVLYFTSGLSLAAMLG